MNFNQNTGKANIVDSVSGLGIVNGKVVMTQSFSLSDSEKARMNKIDKTRKPIEGRTSNQARQMKIMRQNKS